MENTKELIAEKQARIAELKEAIHIFEQEENELRRVNEEIKEKNLKQLQNLFSEQSDIITLKSYSREFTLDNKNNAYHLSFQVVGLEEKYGESYRFLFNIDTLDVTNFDRRTNCKTLEDYRTEANAQLVLVNLLTDNNTKTKITETIAKFTERKSYKEHFGRDYVSTHINWEEINKLNMEIKNLELNLHVGLKCWYTPNNFSNSWQEVRISQIKETPKYITVCYENKLPEGQIGSNGEYHQYYGNEVKLKRDEYMKHIQCHFKTNEEVAKILNGEK